MTERRLHLNAVIYGLGSHEAAWRLPETDPFSIMTLDYWADIARRAERGGFDALFLGDVLALQEGADKHLSNTMDPFVILSALAAVTTRIGLIGTASTSFDHPFHLARRFGSLDHISKSARDAPAGISSRLRTSSKLRILGSSRCQTIRSATLAPKIW